MKINVYVDGFNLYYGAIKRTPYRWLDLLTMCRLLFPNDQINKIKYFTARVSARPSDPDQPIRQATYWRALQTIPNLSIIEGSFLVKPVMMPIANTNPQRYERVIKTEEKGSDVNLAVHLLNDAYKKDYELAVIVTNDSDLLEPMRIVKQELNLPVGLVNPHKNPSFDLRKHATFIKQLRKGVLQNSQFPITLTDQNGTFHKPATW
ncbi:MAG: NYN domain-containing protein [Acidobacteria bacterium]|nr:NYN domain-containing protein [Acidobacteriota bacterium]MCA1638421.1 NYN domain-containing protein [Acidobacteriota bacterium]